MKSCGNCIQCEKYTFGGKERWTCENYAGGEGWPYDVTPPNDEACANWSDNHDDKDRPQDELRYFIDHYWDEEDDW